MVVTAFENFLLMVIQYMTLLLFSIYTLDLNWSKKHYIITICFIFFPTYILFSLIGAPSMLFYLTILAIMVYRETNVISHIFHIFMSLFFLVISDNLSYIISYRLLNEKGNNHYIFIGYCILFILFAVVMAYFYKRIIRYLIDRWVFNSYISTILVFLSVFTVICMYINIVAIDHNNFYESVQNNLMTFMMYLALLAVLMFVVLYVAFKQYKVKQRELELQNFESYVASLEQINQDMRRFKHDYVNILSSLRTFIDDKNYDGLQTYFYQHILDTKYQEQLNEQAMMTLNNLKINSLKGLLTTKILQAQSHHIPFYIEIVEEVRNISVDPIILNRMVGILLDNAIEAAREIENGEVRVAFIHMDEAILLVVSNTFDEKTNIKVHEIFREGFSTKGENRGLGLANLRQMKKDLQNVSLNTKISPPYFIQEIGFERGR